MASADATINRPLIVFLVASTFASSLWLTAGPFGLMAVAAFIVVFARVDVRPWSDAAGKEPRTIAPWEAIVASALVLLPPTLYLFLTWNQEFPFSGDHDYHLIQLQHAYRIWRWCLVPVAAGVVYVAFARRWSASVAIVLLVVGAIGAAMYHGSLWYSIRYPGSFYTVAVLWKALCDFLNVAHPLNAIRLANWSSLLVWLLILRPALLGVRPDLRLAPFAAYAFLQKNVVYYFTASYLEPWAVVLILVATEHLIRFGKADGWKVLLLIGFAAMFKEQAILLLPFYALAVMPRPGDREKMAVWALTSVVAAFPFLLYYMVRTASGVWRTAGLASFADIFSAGRAALFVVRVVDQFGSGLIIVLMCAALTVLFAFRGSQRVAFAAIAGGAIFQIVFLYCDRISVQWTAYPRFHLIPALLFGMVLFADLFQGPLRALLATAVITATMLPSLIPLYRDTQRPDAARNFFEAAEAPIYFPVQSGVRAAEERGLLRGVTTLRLVTNFDTYVKAGNLGAIALAYPRLAQRYRLVGRPLRSGQVPRSCGCSSESEAVFGLFVSTYGAPRPAAELAPVLELADGCSAAIQKTCQRSAVIKFDDRPWGTIGAGVRQAQTP